MVSEFEFFEVRCGEVVVLRDEREMELTRRTCAEISEAGGRSVTVAAWGEVFGVGGREGCSGSSVSGVGWGGVVGGREDGLVGGRGRAGWD